VTFLHWGLFAGAAGAVAIPIIIHLLFRRRRKPVKWGAMRFLLEAYRRQRRRMTLEQWLLLATRCLLILLVGAALARPVVEAAGAIGGGGRTIYLLIDDGLAASVRDEGGETALDRHKQTAGAILASLGPADRAGLITLAAPSEPVVAPATSDLGALEGVVERLAATDAPTDLLSGLERAADAIEAEESGLGEEAVVVVLSDFLLGSVDASRPARDVFSSLLDEGRRVRLLASRPRAQSPGNVQVLGVDPLRPVVLTGAGEDEAALAGGQVRIRLRRTGEAVGRQAATTVRLRAGGAEAEAAPAATGVVRWEAGQTEAVLALALPPDAVSVESDALRRGVALVAEIDRDAVAGDNTFRRPLSVQESLRVGLIDRLRFAAGGSLERLPAGEWVRLALRPDEAAPIEVTEIDPAAIDAASLAGLSAAMVSRPDLVTENGWDRLRRFVDGGGLLVVFPPADARLHVWTDAFLESMDLPWRLAREAAEVESPLRLAAEQPRSELLELIQQDLETLTRPVTIARTLPLEERDAPIEPLLTLEDGRPWVFASEPGASNDQDESAPPGAGLVVYFASAPTLSWTDLPAKPLMVPLVQEIVRQGAARASERAVAQTGARIVAPRGSARLTPVAGSIERGFELDASGKTTEPVRFTAVLAAVDEAGGSRGLVGVNADAEAGRTDVQPASGVERWLGGLGLEDERIALLSADEGGDGAAAALARRSEGGSPISLPLLIAALVLAAAEAVMARFFSHARRDEAPPAVAQGGLA